MSFKSMIAMDESSGSTWRGKAGVSRFNGELSREDAFFAAVEASSTPGAIHSTKRRNAAFPDLEGAMTLQGAVLVPNLTPWPN